MMRGYFRLGTGPDNNLGTRILSTFTCTSFDSCAYTANLRHGTYALARKCTDGGAGDRISFCTLLSRLGYAGHIPFADGYLITFSRPSFCYLGIDPDAGAATRHLHGDSLRGGLRRSAGQSALHRSLPHRAMWRDTAPILPG